MSDIVKELVGIVVRSHHPAKRMRLAVSPEEYRELWNLPHDYPMVSPLYAAQRSDLAKKMGLGQRRDAALITKKSKKA